MRNAKEEFLDSTNTAIAAVVEYVPFPSGTSKVILLKKGHTPEEFNAFLDALDFEYDNGYGTQELFGTIWISPGHWADRGEYDGSEWWDHHAEPPIHQALL